MSSCFGQRLEEDFLCLVAFRSSEFKPMESGCTGIWSTGLRFGDLNKAPGEQEETEGAKMTKKHRGQEGTWDCRIGPATGMQAHGAEAEGRCKNRARCSSLSHTTG